MCSFVPRIRRELQTRATSHLHPRPLAPNLQQMLGDRAILQAVKDAARDALLHHSHGPFSAPVEWWVAPRAVTSSGGSPAPRGDRSRFASGSCASKARGESWRPGWWRKGSKGSASRGKARWRAGWVLAWRASKAGCLQLADAVMPSSQEKGTSQS